MDSLLARLYRRCTGSRCRLIFSPLALSRIEVSTVLIFIGRRRPKSPAGLSTHDGPQSAKRRPETRRAVSNPRRRAGLSPTCTPRAAPARDNTIACRGIEEHEKSVYEHILR